jgi:drug/metabolite transporter (DMT)-like permease
VRTDRRSASAKALLAAALFGASTPASKALLEGVPGAALAGLLYLGAALWVAPAVARRAAAGDPLFPRGSRNRLRLLGAVIFGGGLGPLLVMIALAQARAASVSMWLNLETVATALLGALVFREHVGRLAAAGNAGVFLAGLLLAYDGGLGEWLPGLLVAGAALCWGLDNHLTALIDDARPEETTFWKGLFAGGANLALGAWWAGGLSLDAAPVGAALLVGALSYGASIVLYISAAQSLGAVRSQMIFATAPFLGVIGSVAFLGEGLTAWQVGAGVLLLASNALLALERHEHAHTHPRERHEHAHRHDDGHHGHAHPGLPPGTWHTHEHEHEELEHSHRHLPDLHHRHSH